MTPEQAGLLALMFLLILIGIAAIAWFIISVSNDQTKKTGKHSGVGTRRRANARLIAHP